MRAHKDAAMKPHYSHRRIQRGVSLIEIMVALVIGSVLTAGVINLFLSSKQSYRIQESTTELQENARFALQVMDYGVRMADHWGGVDGSGISGSPTVTGIGGCDSAWILSASEGIRGYEGTSTTAPLPAGCLDDDDYVASSDILVVRYASPNDIVADADLGSATNANTIFVRTELGTGGKLFKGSEGVPAGLPAQDGTYNYPYTTDIYFLRPCSEKGGTKCTSSDDGGSPISTLSRLTLVNGTLTQQPLVEGVEQLQVEYGIDINRDQNADRYVTATTLDGDATLFWSDVINARISTIVRANTTDTSYMPSGNPFAMAGNFSFTPPTDKYRRRMYTNVVQIRNRSRF